MSGKREDFLTWDDFFMSLAFLSAMRSKDPVTQVGAVIVDSRNRVVSIGYNGFPVGCSDDELPWGKGNEDPLNDKYMYVCHAEMNAVLNKNSSNITGCRLFVALFPCNECAKVIIQSGITEVVYYSDKHASKPSNIASKRLLNTAGVKYRQHIPNQPSVEVDFSRIDK